MSVQYIVVYSTLGAVQHIGGYHEYSGDIMSIMGVFSTPGEYCEYTGAYHDECGGYHEYSGGFQYTGRYHEYTRGVQSTGGYHEYTGRISRCMLGLS